MGSGKDLEASSPLILEALPQTSDKKLTFIELILCL